MGLNRDLRIGTSLLWELQVLNADDSVPTGVFQDSDALSFAVWQGSQQAPLIVKDSGTGPDIAWISSADAQFSITLHPEDTANLAAGVYYVEAQATRGSDVADLLPAGTTLTLTDTPGTATPRATYIDGGDLRRLAPWVFDVQAPGSETGFLEQCADSRDWLDENIIRNYPGGYTSLLGEHGTALAAWSTSGSQRSSLRNPWVLQLLAQGPATPDGAGGLILTRRARDLCAYYALSQICEGMLTKGNQYAALAARYRAKCNQLLVCYTAELSVNGQVDQWGQLLAQIPVNFGTARTIRV